MCREWNNFLTANYGSLVSMLFLPHKGLYKATGCLLLFVGFVQSIVDLQCCASFRYTAKWSSYIYVCAYEYIYACMLNRFSHVWLFTTPQTAAHQAPLSMGFSRPEYWSGLSCPSPGDFPAPGIKPKPLNVSCIGRLVLYQQHHLGTTLNVCFPSKFIFWNSNPQKCWY